jgi:hypothetical protein
MTPQEKANELVYRFISTKIVKDCYFDTDMNGEIYSSAAELNNAKQCALICCNEVLGYMGADRGTEFWNEVKREIEKL